MKDARIESVNMKALKVYEMKRKVEGIKSQ